MTEARDELRRAILAKAAGRKYSINNSSNKNQEINSLAAKRLIQRENAAKRACKSCGSRNRL